MIYASRHIAPSFDRETRKAILNRTRQATSTPHVANKQTRQEKTETDKIEEHSSLDRLRLMSLRQLADMSDSDESVEQIATPAIVQTVFDIWNAHSDRDMKLCCSRVLCNIYKSHDMDNDDLLLPILELCSQDPGPQALTSCAVAMLHRLQADRPIEVLFVRGIIAAVSHIEKHVETDTETRCICARALWHMLDNCVHAEDNVVVDEHTEPTKHDEYAAVKEGVTQAIIPLLISFILREDDATTVRNCLVFLVCCRAQIHSHSCACAEICMQVSAPHCPSVNFTCGAEQSSNTACDTSTPHTFSHGNSPLRFSDPI